MGNGLHHSDHLCAMPLHGPFLRLLLLLHHCHYRLHLRACLPTHLRHCVCVFVVKSLPLRVLLFPPPERCKMLLTLRHLCRCQWRHRVAIALPLLSPAHTLP